MSKILIFGNSGSGKSTLAKKLAFDKNLSHLDLDTLAWQPTSPPQRQPLTESRLQINRFVNTNDRWVIEGCYTDLLELIATHTEQIIYMNLPIDLCIANAKRRPWEPHKYPSKKVQDANLYMLIDWISDYTKRSDTFSEAAHRNFYNNFKGKKEIFINNKYNE